ncbi:MAG: hypothetical protein IJ034_05865 [Mailhella sp.]|nr:hypothetical protein [Mailhella sp.]
MTEHDLRLFLRAFHFWHEQAYGHIQRSARTRLLFLCLLIRYSGMRLGEALKFNDQNDMDLKNNTILVREGAIRRIPLTARAMKKLEELRESPGVIREKGILCRMDQGYVRRIFEARGKEAGLPYRVNPSLIRRKREDEMRSMGIAPAAIEYIQGRGGQLDNSELNKIHQSLLTWEKGRHAGRHNVFYGKILELDRRQICTRLTIRTRHGLIIHARCSTRVAAQLEFETGGDVLVTFRSLQGRISLQKGARNSFAAYVEQVYEDGDIKVILELSDGSKCCAVSDDVSLSSALFPGNTVWLNIRDVDFILSACDHTSS